MKRCNSCKTDRPFDHFHKRKASKDGLASKCKSCQSEYDKARANNPDRVKARAEYAKTERGRIAGSRAKKRWQEKNTVKRAAHVITGNAIRDGKLQKIPCEVCGDKKVHAHHDDYAKPLSVRWLCDIHHNQWHKENGEGLNCM